MEVDPINEAALDQRPCCKVATTWWRSWLACVKLRNQGWRSTCAQMACVSVLIQTVLASLLDYLCKGGAQVLSPGRPAVRGPDRWRRAQCGRRGKWSPAKSAPRSLHHLSARVWTCEVKRLCQLDAFWWAFHDHRLASFSQAIPQRKAPTSNRVVRARVSTGIALSTAVMSAVRPESWPADRLHFGASLQSCQWRGCACRSSDDGAARTPALR